jgi:dolichol-phosphate mannosyltransferase
MTVDMQLSVVIPACNEAHCVGPLAREIRAALAGRGPFEIIVVDDGSTDGTSEAVTSVRDSGVPEIRLLRHSRRVGQSAAVLTGVRAARAPWIATLDGDGQNDPVDIVTLLDALAAQRDPQLKLVMGQRIVRKDAWLRRIASRIANGVRARMLRDGAPDTGCGLKLMHRETFLELPHFNHMHRFLPALFRSAGANVISTAVNHRARTHGTSKYGVWDRLWVGVVDLFGVRWLIARTPPPIQIVEQ